VWIGGQAADAVWTGGDAGDAVWTGGGDAATNVSEVGPCSGAAAVTVVIVCDMPDRSATSTTGARSEIRSAASRSSAGCGVARGVIAGGLTSRSPSLRAATTGRGAVGGRDGGVGCAATASPPAADLFEDDGLEDDGLEDDGLEDEVLEDEGLEDDSLDEAMLEDDGLEDDALDGDALAADAPDEAELDEVDGGSGGGGDDGVRARAAPAGIVGTLGTANLALILGAAVEAGAVEAGAVEAGAVEAGAVEAGAIEAAAAEPGSAPNGAVSPIATHSASALIASIRPWTGGGTGRGSAGISAGRGATLGGGGRIASRAFSRSPSIVLLSASGAWKRSVMPTRPWSTEGVRAALTTSASPSIITPPSRSVMANRLRLPAGSGSRIGTNRPFLSA
jgi:hypothetical protein